MCGSNDGNSKEDTQESQGHEFGEIERCVESDGCGTTTEGYKGGDCVYSVLFQAGVYRRLKLKKVKHVLITIRRNNLE